MPVADTPSSEPEPLFDELRALQAKVDAFAQAVQQRRSDDMECRAGCAGCCHTQLSASVVEAALISAFIAALPQDAQAQLKQQAAAVDTANTDDRRRCAMLTKQEHCAIYPVRPLICRTQGLPLQYPAELIPAESIYKRRSESTAVTWCPLNFTKAEPSSPDTLNAERVDQLLGVVNLRYAHARAVDPAPRTALSVLAQQLSGSNPR